MAEQVGADLTLLVRGGMDAIAAAREELGEVLRSDSGSRRKSSPPPASMSNA